ncbi:MAG: M23 family metallopeptidase [Proteobacteria bacterium]|nr:M23 family metallopeptidase [Pseudomonadota bacterium]
MRVAALGLAALALMAAAPADLAPKKHAPAKPAKAKPKAAPAETPPDEESEHVVREGETLGGIAARARIPRVLIIEANGLKAPYAVKAGQKLTLPRTRHHTVKPGETGFDIAMHYGVPFSAIAVANGMARDAVLKPGQKLLIPTVIQPATPAAAEPGKAAARAASAAAEARDAASAPEFVWPLAGKVVRPYASRATHNYHDGIDIVAPAGTAVRATAAGKVIFAGEEPQSFGQLVVIDHGHGWQSAYGFLSRVTVNQGDNVRARERVGLVGRSGKAPRDQLHFELRRANKPTDPAGQLPEAPKGGAEKPKG